MRKISNEIQSTGSKFNLGEYWRIIWRKKLLLLVPLLIPLIVAAVGVRFLVPVYEASSLIRMEDKLLLAREVARYVQLQERRRMHDKETLARIEAELETSSFLDLLIKRLGMDKNPKLIRWASLQRRNRFPDLSTEELINRKLRKTIHKKLKVEHGGPGMFRISCFDYDPEACYIVANAATNLFIESQQKKQIEGLQEVSDFGDEHLAVYKERLEKSERELDRFKRKMNQRKIASNPVGENSIRYAETLSKQIDISVKDEENVVARIRSNLIALFGAVPSSEKIWKDEGWKKIENKLIAHAETQLLLELATRGEGSEEARRNSREIDKTGRDLQRYLSNLVQVSYTDIYRDYHPLIVEYYVQLTELESYKQKHKLLASYINAFKKRLELAPQLDREFEKLKEAVETNRKIYNSFLTAKTSTQITEAVQNTDLGVTIEIVEKASKPLAPVRPNKPKIIVVALLFGGFLGIGSLLVSEYSDTSFRTVEEIQEELELKILGTVPRFEASEKWPGQAQRRKILIWAAASIIISAAALMGFYYYGKSTEGKKLDVYSVSLER